MLELVSKDSRLPLPGRACEAAAARWRRASTIGCPAARAAALEQMLLDRARPRTRPEAGVCPYHLTQELARWCDVIVADYNYFFDTSARSCTR